MNKQDVREELKESFDRQQLVQRNIDQSIDMVLRLDPIENILKQVDDEELEDMTRDHVQSMMNEWLDMYRDVLEEARTAPADLIGRSAEIARENRKNPVENPKRDRRR